MSLTPTRARRTGGRMAGFTLVELVIVMSIMIVIAGLAVPRIATGRYRADAVAYSVRSAIQKAQRIAVQRQHDIIVGFDVPNQRVGVFEDRNSNGAIDAGERLLWEPLGEGRFATPPFGLAGPVDNPVVGPAVELSGMQTMAFRRNGSATTAAEIYLSSGRPDEKDLRAIAVTRSTGRSETFRMRNGQWIKEGA